ncbi:hypothetical protein IQ07DRAFT_631853 [Pyrenochaeta sp. DS3sAY3a]|nr:hypothetical protein IQ07DRAFT_631853 [Pyrenochaeta sp. DS3sAY3a]
MAGRRNNNLAYFQDQYDQLKGIPLPAKIRCGRCLKHKAEANFSIKQLNEARLQVQASGKITKAPTCKPCTGQRIVEIECHVCGETKGLEQFAKTQRREPDTAVCYQCTEERVNHAPVDEEAYENPDQAFYKDHNTHGTCPDYFAPGISGNGSTSNDDWKDTSNNAGGVALLSADLENMKFSKCIEDIGDASESSYSSISMYKNGPKDGGVDVRTESWHTTSSRPASSASGNPSKSESKPSTTASELRSERTFGSSVAERSNITGSNSSGWAKKSSIPLGQPMRPMGDISRDSEALVDTADSDDDADEYDYDDDSDDETEI